MCCTIPDWESSLLETLFSLKELVEWEVCGGDDGIKHDSRTTSPVLKSLLSVKKDSSCSWENIFYSLCSHTI